jgi:hypothetical protein
VISGKYGFYRGGHLKIFNSCPNTTWMLERELIASNEVFHKAGFFQKELSMYFELENIPQDMKINIVRNKPFYTGTDQQEKEMRHRLSDETLDEIEKYYVRKQDMGLKEEAKSSPDRF